MTTSESSYDRDMANGPANDPPEREIPFDELADALPEEAEQACREFIADDGALDLILSLLSLAESRDKLERAQTGAAMHEVDLLIGARASIVGKSARRIAAKVTARLAEKFGEQTHLPY